MSRPGLSQQIRELEERMGVQLLDRTGRKVRPTDAGEAYLRHVQRALDELEVGGRAIRDVQDLSSAPPLDPGNACAVVSLTLLPTD